MKKVLALALALCMVFAMGTVAFAAGGTTVQLGDANHDDKPETVLIQTTFTEDLEEYTVTIPADLELPWKTAASSLTANVKGQIVATHIVRLSVAMPAALTLDGVTATLAVTAENTTMDVSDADIITGKDLTTTFGISGYDVAPIGTYTGLATYTVLYV